jgi:hypothetical protein
VRRAGAPDFLGYLVCYLVTVAAVSLPFAVIALLDPAAGTLEERLFGALFVGVLGALMAAVYGLPSGLAGCVVLHLVLRRVSSQTVHVVAFTAVGALVGWAYDVWLFDSGFAWLPIALGCATAVGRLSVVPLVRRTP